MIPSFDARIARATELMQTHPAASDVLCFYRELARFQKPLYNDLESTKTTDFGPLICHFPALLALVRRAGPGSLADFGAEHLQDAAALRESLTACWEGKPAPSEPARFYARVLLQPYAEHLASRGQIDFDTTPPTC